jgi:TonB family protein
MQAQTMWGIRRLPPRVAMFSTCALPAYPRDDLQARHMGTMDFEVLLNPGGNVLDSRVVKSSGYASLDEAVRAAFVKCRFNAVGDTGPVEQWQRIRYIWTIDN